MTALGMVNLALAGINIALALVLGVVYWRNHREIRSPFTLGLLLFASFLVVHNGVFLYHAFTMMEAVDAAGETLLLLEGLLQMGAVGTIVMATLR